MATGVARLLTGRSAGRAAPRVRKARTLGSGESASRVFGLPWAIIVFVSASRKTELSPIAKMLASSWRDDDDRGAEAVAQLEDQVVEAARADRVEPGGRLVEEQDLGVERHRAGEPGALLHAAADLGGGVVLEAREPDQRELQRGDLADLGRPRGR